MLPTVGVVILTHNSKEYIEKCLISVLKSEYRNFEIVVVDSASEDGTVELIERKFGRLPCLRIIKLNRNVYYARGNNIGAKYTNADYIVFLNDDTHVLSDWLNHLVNVMKDHRVAACQPKIVFETLRLLDSAGDYLTPWGFLIHVGHMRADDSCQGDKTIPIFSAKGACFMVKRDVFLRAGGFEESFGMYFEETDLCWRLWLMGYRVVYVPSSVIFHRSPHLRKRNPLSIWFGAYLGFRNRILSLATNLETRNVMKILPIHILLCAGIALYLAAHKRTLEGAYIIMSLISILRLVPNIIRRRKFIKYIRRVSDAKIFPYILRKPNPRHFIALISNYLKISRETRGK